MGKIVTVEDCFNIAERTFSNGSDYFKKGKNYCLTYTELKNWFDNRPTMFLSLKGNYSNNQLVQMSDIVKLDNNGYFNFSIDNYYDYTRARFQGIEIRINNELHSYQPNTSMASYKFALTGTVSYTVDYISIAYENSTGGTVTAGHNCSSGNMNGLISPGQTIPIHFDIVY